MTAITHPESVPIARSEPTVAVRRRTIDTVLIGVGAVSPSSCSSPAACSSGAPTSPRTTSTTSCPRRTSRSRRPPPSRRRVAPTSCSTPAQVDTGPEAEAYASFIDGHLAASPTARPTPTSATPERAANAAVEEATASGAPANEVAALEADAAAITGQRNTLFKGETLRGLLLSAFAWSTVGRIAGIAAWSPSPPAPRWWSSWSSASATTTRWSSPTSSSSARPRPSVGQPVPGCPRHVRSADAEPPEDSRSGRARDGHRRPSSSLAQVPVGAAPPREQRGPRSRRGRPA